MKEHPILFSGPMVRALLAGTKTQTRRVFSAHMIKLMRAAASIGEVSHFLDEPVLGQYDLGYILDFCPYGQAGDRLWVKETFTELLAVSPASDEPIAIGPGERLLEAPTSYTDAKGRKRWNYDGRVVAYRANSDVEFCDGDGFSGDTANRDDMPKWKPSIFMPRWASRITLEIVKVRVERLNDITEADALAEGVTLKGGQGYDGWAKAEYMALWDSINGAGSWALNPWVWVVEFKKVDT